MNFNDWETSYSLRSKEDKRDWFTFHHEAIIKYESQFQNDNSVMDQNVFDYEVMLMEANWYAEGKPYYKIYPQIVDEFIRTPINISCSLLMAAHESFLIRLPKEPLLDFRINGQHYQVKSILVDTTELHKVSSTLFFLADCSECVPGITQNSFLIHTPIRMDKHKLIENVIPEQCVNIIDNMEFNIKQIPTEIKEACVRLVVGVCFLSTGSHKIFEYDVLGDLLEKYRQLAEDSPERKRIEEKSKKRGKYGWNIGRGFDGRYLTLPRGVTYTEAVRAAGGRERLYQHKRGGHWRELIPGVDKPWKEYKVIWIDAMEIRPDLPPKPLDENVT